MADGAEIIDSNRAIAEGKQVGVGEVYRTPYDPAGLVEVMELEPGEYHGRRTAKVLYLVDHPDGYKRGEIGRYLVDELRPTLGLEFSRNFTKPGRNPFDEVEWEQRTIEIRNDKGNTIFLQKDVEVPTTWSQTATNIVTSKYFHGKPNTVQREHSVRQLIARVGETIVRWGEEGGYFGSPESREIFRDELTHLLLAQKMAFNSPVWFNVGVQRKPQCSACFINSVQDKMESIMELAKTEGMLFKWGSGTGTNFSTLRGSREALSGGGTASGPVSFMRGFDAFAGVIKSGGKTRRAAKMVILNVDHPDIPEFIDCKVKEERKARVLIERGYDSSIDGEAYSSIFFQNANHSVRVTDEFMQAAEEDLAWWTRNVTDGKPADQFRARSLLRRMAESAWNCGDPGIQYDSTINRWHTCKATDRIYASNPCSEFVFLDDTACNLASLNLLKFLREEGGSADRRAGAGAEASGGKTGKFDVEGYKHACRVFFLAQEIAVDLASYPTKRIAERSQQFRPLGLGYANLGTLLMVEGLPYDSDEGRAYAGAITAVMTGEAYALSAEMAASKGPFQGFSHNRESMLQVMRMHRDSVQNIDLDLAPAELLAAAHEVWNRAVALGEQHGYRNAQATVLAPTGTIGLLMDCDTTGVEPDFALIKFKKLAGGGSFKIVNQSVPRALKKLGYSAAQVQAIVDSVRGTATLKGVAEFSPAELESRGLLPAEIAKVEKSLESVFDLRAAFAPHVIGPAALQRLGLEAGSKGKQVLAKLGYTDEQIDAATLVVCGRQTVEGAPFLQPEHYPVFDCANRCGPLGTRYIEPMGHVRMMAAVQPFLSGAISKTINLPQDATVEEVEKIHWESWRIGLKAIALYRDGSKLSQPLSAGDQAPKLPLPKDAKEMAQALQKLIPDLGKDRAQRMAEVAFEAKAAAAPAQLAASVRRRLPPKRHGITQEAKVGGNKVFLRTGEYNDGELGEIFIDMHKEGAALRSVMNCFAMLVSIALQYGVPLEVLVEQFVFTRFEPQGPVQGHDRVKFATSVIDYVFRALGVEYLKRDDLAHVTPEEAAETPKSAQTADPLVPAPHAASPANAAKAAQRSNPPDPARAAARAQDELLGKLSGDAPFCDTCGHITVRNGTCYKCLNCGNSMGCS